jgi:hypothetical protein
VAGIALSARRTTPDEKKLFIRQVEVFAAYAAYNDYEIGRVIQQFQDLGRLDNTLVMYINGDNGTSAEGGPLGTPNEVAWFNGLNELPVDVQMKFYDVWGTEQTYNHMISNTLGASFGGTTCGAHHGFDWRASSLITPPNFGSGGGSCFPSIVVVALGDPRGPVTLCEIAALVPIRSNKEAPISPRGTRPLINAKDFLLMCRLPRAFFAFRSGIWPIVSQSQCSGRPDKSPADARINARTWRPAPLPQEGVCVPRG